MLQKMSRKICCFKNTGNKSLRIIRYSFFEPGTGILQCDLFLPTFSSLDSNDPRKMCLHGTDGYEGTDQFRTGIKGPVWAYLVISLMQLRRMVQYFRAAFLMQLYGSVHIHRMFYCTFTAHSHCYLLIIFENNRSCLIVDVTRPV